ncbi:hypothetical protein XAC908_560018 [Xanthomonas citri pv. citri]|nr:hypothetical protein XAC908_560018 [Xanthomonas citri pv. citri]
MPLLRATKGVAFAIRSTILEREATRAIAARAQTDRLTLSYAPPSGMGAALASGSAADNGYVQPSHWAAAALDSII